MRLRWSHACQDAIYTDTTLDLIGVLEAREVVATSLPTSVTIKVVTMVSAAPDQSADVDIRVHVEAPSGATVGESRTRTDVERHPMTLEGFETLAVDLQSVEFHVAEQGPYLVWTTVGELTPHQAGLCMVATR